MRDSSLRRSTWLTASAIAAASGWGWRSKAVKSARTCAAVTAGVFPPQPQPLQLQEPQGQQRQSHVVLPAHPTAYLILRQADLLLALLQTLLDAVSPAVHLRQLPTPRLPRVGQRIPRLRLRRTT